MKRSLAVFLILLFNYCYAQDISPKVYHWDDLPLVYEPDTIYHLSFRKMKLDELPESLAEFRQLRSLDLSKNKLTALPEYFSTFKSLESINLERNKLEVFPIVFCRMTSLNFINLGMNTVSSIPSCIESLLGLKRLLLYDNPITSLPSELAELKQLKELDLSGIRFSDTFQYSWIERLPNAKVVFDAPCDCFE